MMIRLIFPLFFVSTLFSSVFVSGVRADITTDGSLGSAVNLSGPEYEIAADLGKQAGGNLFHSFGKFGLDSGESATFTGPDSVRNVISRISGGNPSYIDGLIRSAITGADFFFLNPSGMMFGPNASLDISGSFHISTADYLRMGESDLFYAMPMENEILSVASPSAFGFLDKDSYASITFEGSFLEVPEKETVSVIGGDIFMHDSTLFAESGRVNLASVVFEGEVRPGEKDLEISGTGKLGKIDISREAEYIKYNETSSYYGDIEVTGFEDGKSGGSVYIRGGQFVMNSGTIGADTKGNEDGGGINIRVTDDILLNGSLIECLTSGAGTGGNISVSSSELILEGGKIYAATTGEGDAGTINLDTGKLSFTEDAIINVNTMESGKGGNLSVSAKESVNIGSESLILANTFGAGDGGSISVSATEFVSSGKIQAVTQNDGNAGNITVESDRFYLNDGGQIITYSSGSSGNAGNITVNASESVQISGKDAEGNKSNLDSSVYQSSGKGGNISVSSAELLLEGGAIYSGTTGEGNAGTVHLDTGTLSLTEDAVISVNTSGSGKGGNLSVSAKESVNIGSESRILANSSGKGDGGSISVSAPEFVSSGKMQAVTENEGNAGNITVESGRFYLKDGGRIITYSNGSSGNAGNITVSVNESVLIAGKDEEGNKAKLDASVYQSSGKGGDITVTSPEIILTDGDIYTVTSGDGDAGTIQLNSDKLYLKEDALISATTTGGGNAGTIHLQTGKLSLTEGATISVNTNGAGKGGEVIINAEESVSLSGNPDKKSSILANTFNTENGGEGGSIQISAPLVGVYDYGQIQAAAQGSGNGGDITITAENVELVGVTGINISAGTGSTGNGGNLTITASEDVIISGHDENFIPGGIVGTVDSVSNGGTIMIIAPSLIIDDQGAIQLNTMGSGNAANLLINISRLEIHNAGHIENSTGIGSSGNGGNVIINATDFVLIDGFNTPPSEELFIQQNVNSTGVWNSGITSRTEGSGNGGNITINSPILNIQERGQIESNSTGSGKGGEISITAEKINLNNGHIDSFTVGSGDGGEIEIKADSVNISGWYNENNTNYPSGLGVETTGSGKGGIIDLDVSTLVMSDGAQIRAGNRGGSTGEGGNISISAKESVIIKNSDKAEKADIDPGILNRAGGTNNTGRTYIETPYINIDGGVISSEAQGTGNAGEIHLNVSRLELVNGGQINSGTEQSGNGAELIIEASESVSISGKSATEDQVYSMLLSATEGSGSGGKIYIQTPELKMDNDGMISTSTKGIGTAGDIEIFSENFNISGDAEIQAATFSEGAGGNINIHLTGICSMDNGIITASGENKANGKPGKIVLHAESINLSGGSQINAVTAGKEKGGDINISANESVQIKGTDTEGFFSGIFADTQGESGGGQGGKIEVTAPELMLADSGQIRSRSDGSGDAGEIIINTDMISMNGDSKISSESKGSGRGGELTVNSEDSFFINNSSITTETTQSDGGDISIRTGSLLYLKDASVTTSVQGGEGTGGNISVSDSEFLVMNRSHIKADAHGGDGGNIFIGAEHFLASAASSVTASSALRNDGEITVLSPEEDISASLTSLPQNLMDASRWASTPCRLRSGEEVSRFILGLRDTLPESPDDLLPSPPRKTGIPEADQAFRTGNYPELIRICGKILSDTEIPLSPEQHTDILMLTAFAYQAQGHMQKALTVYDSLHNIIPGKDAGRKALYYAALADAYLVSGKKEKVREFSERAETAAELSSDPFVTARIYNHLGNFHTVEAVKNRNKGYENRAGESAEKAGDFYRKGLRLLKNERSGLKNVLTVNLSLLFLLEKQYDKILPLLTGVFREIQEMPDSHEKAWMLLSAGTAAMEMSGYADADPARPLETAAHTAENTGNTRTASFAYGYLGNFYEQKGEHEKALSLTRQALFAARQSGATEIIYQWEGQAGRIFRSLKKEEDALSAYQRAAASLNPGCENDDCPPVLVSEMFRGGHRIPRNLFTETVRPLYGELAELTVRKAENLKDESEKEKLLEKVLTGTESLRMLELQDFYQDECVTADQRRKAPDNRAFAETALLWPLLLPEKPVLLVRFPDGLKMFPLPASSEEISGTAAKLAGELRKRESGTRIQGYGARLYRYLIRPLEKELNSRNIRTLVISPDGELRTLPFAVLYDGKKYLAEKYALATVPALSLTDTSARKETHSGVLLAGLSQETVLDGETFPPLPNVRTETEGIRETAGGKSLLDENFTRKNIGSELRQNSYSAVNFSTHGHFGGSAEDTFLLAYDGKIGPSDMETLIHISRFREEKTDLLTLSACETGVGDERAALGLGGAAVRTGVKTVLASLWKVDDESTALLMTEFYRQARTGNVTMAEALRLSQMKLLAHPEYRHPYFWSAFLLIGNWM